MAKNDYFVIAYRILTYLYECFLTGEKPDRSVFGPDALGVSNGGWANTMESLVDEGYIKGVVISETLGGAPSVALISPKITQKGIVFLQENSMIAKAKRALKEIKDTVPGF